MRLGKILRKGFDLFMRTSKKEYAKMAQEASPKSKTLKNCTKAFFIGGAICTLGQLLINTYMILGFTLKEGRMLTSVTLVFLGSLFTAFGWYDKLAKHGGAGTLVPITGFANAIVSPAIEFKTEGYITGLGAKMFAIAGPVLVFGITASVIYGAIYCLVKLFM